MQTQVFTLRMDKPTAAALEKLARATERSKVGVVRWLIRMAGEEFYSFGEKKVIEAVAPKAARKKRTQRNVR